MAVPLNPRFHHELVALCALYYSGEVSEEEWALLQIHMGYCESCHVRFLKYQQIVSGVIPAMAAAAVSELDNIHRESDAKSEVSERRLMDRLDPTSVHRELLRPRKSDSLYRGVLFVACGLILAGVVGVKLARMNIGSDARASQTPKEPSPILPADAAPESMQRICQTYLTGGATDYRLQPTLKELLAIR